MARRRLRRLHALRGRRSLPQARLQHRRARSPASRPATTTARTSRRTSSSSSGECLLLIEGEERPLRQWDFVHCPDWTEHVFVGAGDGPCAILAVGTRSGGGVVYPRPRWRSAMAPASSARRASRARRTPRSRRTSRSPTATAGFRGSRPRDRPATRRSTAGPRLADRAPCARRPGSTAGPCRRRRSAGGDPGRVGAGARHDRLVGGGGRDHGRRRDARRDRLAGAGRATTARGDGHRRAGDVALDVRRLPDGVAAVASLRAAVRVVACSAGCWWPGQPRRRGRNPGDHRLRRVRPLQPARRRVRRGGRAGPGRGSGPGPVPERRALADALAGAALGHRRAPTACSRRSHRRSSETSTVPAGDRAGRGAVHAVLARRCSAIRR